MSKSGWGQNGTQRVNLWNCVNKVDFELKQVMKGNRCLICFLMAFRQLIWTTSCVHKNTDRHTAHTIVSWPNPKQWVIVHTSDSMMIIRESIYILPIITREIGQLKTHSPTCFAMDNREYALSYSHTRQTISDRHFMSSTSSDKLARWW